MGFWSSETIEERIRKEKLIRPFVMSNLQNASYELSVGDEYFITSNGNVKIPLSPKQQFSIPPGQFALLITKEVVRVPKDAIGLISIKAKVKFAGLINVSGFHVDPTFQGKLKFAVYNAGSEPIPITEGAPLFMIWFADLDKPTGNVYDGEHARQHMITDDDVKKINSKMASPAALDKRLRKLEDRYKSTSYFVIGVMIAVVAALMISGINYFIQNVPDKTNNIQKQNYIETSDKVNPMTETPKSKPKDKQ